jgi:hypothetical protein
MPGRSEANSICISQDSIESSLQIIHDISTENIGALCISKFYSPLKIPLTTERYDGVRQKSDLASVILQDLGFNRHSGEFFELKAIKSFSFNQRRWFCLNNFMTEKGKSFYLSHSARHKLSEGIHSSLLLRSTFHAQFNNRKKRRNANTEKFAFHYILSFRLE